MNPGVGDSMFITTSVDACPGLNLVIQGHLVALPYWQLAHIGGGTFAMGDLTRPHFGITFRHSKVM